MDNHYVAYSIRIKGFCLHDNECIDCNIDNSSIIDSVAITQNGIDKFNIRFLIKNDVVLESMKDEKFVFERDNIINNMACSINNYVGDIVLESENVSVVKPCSADFSAYAKIVSPADKIKELKEVIKQNDILTPMKYLYRSALSIEDEIARFMVFYSILELKYRTQKEIDDYILRKNDATEMRDANKRNGEPIRVTIFTYLRNAIGHTKRGANLSETKKEIKAYLPIIAEYSWDVACAEEHSDGAE